MPHIKSKTVFYFDELDDSAKEKAREWYRDGALDYEWWDGVYDYCQDFLKYIGFELDPEVREDFLRWVLVTRRRRLLRQCLVVGRRCEG